MKKRIFKFANKNVKISLGICNIHKQFNPLNTVDSEMITLANM